MGTKPRIYHDKQYNGGYSYFPITYKTNILKNVLNIASVVWAIVTVAAVLTAFLLYYFTKTELRTATLMKDNIYKSDKITAPAVYGFVPRKVKQHFLSTPIL